MQNALSTKGFFQTESLSPSETENVGRALAETLLKDTSLPPFLALYGDLGVGKTAFTRGVASVIAPNSLVRSPTYALVNEYRAVAGIRFRSLFHFDMYRIDSEDDLDSIGFWDYPDRNGLILIEWSEKIPYALPDTYLRVTIEKTDTSETHRRIRIEYIGKEN